MRLSSCASSWFLVVFLTLLPFPSLAADGPQSPSAAQWPPAAQPGPLGQHVNPLIGTGGNTLVCGNNFPGATLPFGMVRLSPDTVDSDGAKASNMSGYYYGDPYLLGFSHTRLVGTGAIDGGNFLVVPHTSPFTQEKLETGERLPFTHDRELAFPGYYAVELSESKILAELTATQRVGVHRYTFPEGQTPHLRIHVSSALGKGRSTDANVRFLAGGSEFEGSTRTFGSFSSRYGGLPIYFVARLSKPIAGHTVWQEQSLLPDQRAASGDRVGIDLHFERTSEPTPIVLQLAISYVSMDNARENLDAETRTAGFDSTLRDAIERWEEQLAKARVEGGSDEEQRIYYSSLYRAMNMPTTFNDVNGQYLGFDRQVHRADDFTYYTDMSLWDTFRTAHPLYTLILPHEQRDMVRSLVEMSRHGGYLPRWPSGAGYTNSMFGTPADIVIAESVLKGIRDFDIETAYAAIKKTAMASTPPGAPSSGREGIEDYLALGYCPHDRVRKSVARTLEYCYADHAIARLAEAMGKDEDAAMFDQRAQYYRNLWNPETQYFQPKDSQGRFFEPFRPLMLTYVDFSGDYTSAYVEGSALQWRWCVPHDPAGLISLFRSREEFVAQLESFFAKSKPKVGALPNAHYWHGNQPDLFAAYLFNSAGRPDLTQKWVRWILQHKYGAGPDGLDGNDDGGTLSAWYVFSSLGLYPIAGTDRYELGSPIWKRAELAVGPRTLVIVADDAAPDRPYVRRVLWNGEPLSGHQVRHGQLAEGGELRFEMTSVAP